MLHLVFLFGRDYLDWFDSEDVTDVRIYTVR